MFLFKCLTYHLVGDNVFHRDIVLTNDGEKVFDGTVDLVVGERFLEGVALEYYSYSEEIAFFSISKNRVSSMPCHVGRCCHDVSGAIVVDDYMCAHFFLR